MNPAAPPSGLPSGPCIGVLLAGGSSSRMGQDKAMLRWAGRPLIEHQIGVLRQAGVSSVLVSGVRPLHAGIPDLLPGRGPLGGIAAVAGRIADGSQLLIVPVDMPLIDAALLARLAGELPYAPCLRFAGHILPMRWRLDPESRARLQQLVAKPDPKQRSLRALQRISALHEIGLSPEEKSRLADCNSPRQWDEAGTRATGAVTAAGRPAPF